MATSYEGPATLHVGGTSWPVTVHLSTTVGAAYSWQGTASTTDLAALGAQGSGGTLTLPEQGAAGVHIPVTELHPGGGVVVRLHGVGRAPYEVDGDIVSRVDDDGATIYEKMRP